jgi:hypothetical protein
MIYKKFKTIENLYDDKKSIISLIISIEKVNKKKYNGWNGYCPGAKQDADNITNMLMDKYNLPQRNIIPCDNGLATWSNVKGWLKRFIKAAVAKKNIDFFIYYTGHGKQIDDISGDEGDGKDEVFCFYDRIVVDDEFRQILYDFPYWCNITIVTDCCFSETICDVMPTESLKPFQRTIDANVWHLASCLDSQSALTKANSDGSLFTTNLIEQLQNDSCISYKNLIYKLNKKLCYQKCTLSTSKTDNQDNIFLNYKKPKFEKESVGNEIIENINVSQNQFVKLFHKVFPHLKKQNSFKNIVANVKNNANNIKDLIFKW